MDDDDTQRGDRQGAPLPRLGPKYEVLGELGSGGMGSVVKARHVAIDRVRAVKVLKRELLLEDEEYFERFRREAMIASDLSHENIVRVFDFDFTPDRSPYITMELLEGENLQQLVGREGALGWERAVELLSGVAEALDKAHEQGVVHRDLKPANLFLTTEGVVKILDFGISRIEQEGGALTGTGDILGTPLYMAPEQLRAEQVDARTDVYALAAVAYELVTGKRAVEATNPSLVVAEVLDKTPPLASEHVPDLPEHVVDALARGLAKEPGERFGTASALVGALDGKGTEGTAGTKVALGSEPGGKGKRWPVVAAVVAVLVVIGVVVWVLSSGESAEETDEPAPVEGPMQIVVLPAAVDLEGVEDDWVSGAVGKLTAMYLELDDRLEVIPCPDVSDELDDNYAKTGVPPAAVGKRLQLQIGNGTVVGLRLYGQRNDQRLVFTAVEAGSGETLWAGEAHGEGFEQPIEELTWEFGEEALAQIQHPPIARDDIGRCGSQEEDLCRKALMAEQALVDLGLLPRLGRVIREKAPGTSLDFLAFFHHYLATEKHVPIESSAPALLSEERRGLWKQYSKGVFDPKHTPHALCEMIDSDDALVKGVSQMDRRCGPLSRSLCAEVDLYVYRRACLFKTLMLDDADVNLKYTEKFAETDLAQPAVAFLSSIVDMKVNPENSRRWLDRASLRAGAHHLVANGYSRLMLFTRDAPGAIYWGRFCKFPERREGAALLISGKFHLALRLLANSVVETSRATQLNSSEATYHLTTRPAFQPVVLLQDQRLAAAWVDLLDGIDSEMIESSRELARAIRDSDREICRKPVDSEITFTMERLYYCRQWKEIAELADEPVEGEFHRMNDRFYVAEALLELGRVDAAYEKFALVESDSISRVQVQVASLLSLERLGRVAELKGDKDKARGYYAELVRVWNETDIPVPEVEAARKALERLKDE